MFCSECGTQHDDTAKFCPKCGTASGTTSTVSPSKTPGAMSGLARLGGWACVLAAVAVLVVLPFNVAGPLSFALSWVGFAIVITGRSTIIKVAKGLVGAVIVAGAWSFWGQQLLTSTQPSMQVELGTLLGDYKSNEVGADQKYNGKVVETE